MKYEKNNMNKNRINELLELYKSSDNYQELQSYSIGNRPILKRDLLEAKMRIDCHNNVMTLWVFHPSQEEDLRKIFPEKSLEDKESLYRIFKIISEVSGIAMEDIPKPNQAQEEKLSIWGTDILFTDLIDPKMAMALAVDDNGELIPNSSSKISNSIAVLNLN